MPRKPEFPPLISGHPVGASDPFAVAAAEAASGRAGGGDLYWQDTDHKLKVAIVLEPDGEAAEPETVHLATMVALGDCVGALAPPEVGVFYRWPDKITVNGAVAGVASLIVGPRDGGTPAWLITGVDLDIRAEHPVLEPGRTPDVTTLWDEGCSGIAQVHLLESFARHLNTWVHTFETEGARPVVEAWLARAEGRGGSVTVGSGERVRSGAFLGLDENGDLILKTEGGTVLLSLKDALL